MSITKETKLVDIEMGLHQVRGLLEDILRKQDENILSLTEQTVLIQETIKNLLVATSANMSSTSPTPDGKKCGAPLYIQRLRLT